MFEIDRHIEILLLKHNCVIVPGFGGFIAHHVSARYDESDGMMLPPMRTVGFSPQLTLNDSLLVQSYIESYDLSYPEALRMIEDEVAEMRAALERDRQLELSSIGRLYINRDGRYEFEPCLAGILTPSCYALTGIEVDRLNSGKTPKEVFAAEFPASTGELQIADNFTAEVDAEASTDETNEEKASVPTISATSWYKLMAASILLLVAFSIPFVLDSGLTEELNLSSLNFDSLTRFVPQDDPSKNLPATVKVKVAPPKTEVTEVPQEPETTQTIIAEEKQQEIVVAPTPKAKPQPAEGPNASAQKKERVKTEASPVKESTKQTATTVLAKSKTEEPASAPQPKATKSETIVKEQKSPTPKRVYYTIVLSSGINIACAEDYVNNLHSRGYIAARTISNGNRVRVVHGRYFSYEDARQMRDNLQQLPEFENCWVLEMQ